MIPLQELLQMSGLSYPCTMTLVQSWLFLPVWGAPFALRSLRVLIATSKGERSAGREAGGREGGGRRGERTKGKGKKHHFDFSVNTESADEMQRA